MRYLHLVGCLIAMAISSFSAASAQGAEGTVKGAGTATLQKPADAPGEIIEIINVNAVFALKG